MKQSLVSVQDPFPHLHTINPPERAVSALIFVRVVEGTGRLILICWEECSLFLLF